MDDARIGRTIRLLRYRRGWRQRDLAAHCNVSKSAISDMERGHVSRYTLATSRRVLAALDASVELFPLWGGHGDLDRLLDRDHARLVQDWAERHRRAGWDIWPEASYSVYGERGRVDLMAFHRATRTLEVVECKTSIWDVQDTVGRLDAKVRLAPRVAAERGWRADRVVGALVVAEGSTARRRVADHAAIFASYSVRGRAATRFVNDPERGQGGGLLVFLSLSPSNTGGRMRAGRRRMRLPAQFHAPVGPAEARGPGPDV